MNKVKECTIIPIKEKIVSKEFKINLKERENITKDETISIVSDTMFKTMFMSEKRIKYSAKLLSYFLDYSYDYLLENLHFAKNELSKDKEFSKGERCDFVAEIDDGFVNIEVNSNDTKYAMKRNVEYAFKLYLSSSKVGEDYRYKSIVQLNINNFSYKNEDKIVDYFSVCNNKGESLTEDFIIVQIYLPNIYKKCYTLGIESLTERERYLLVLAEQNISKAKEYALEDNVMKEYVSESQDVITDNGFGESYDHEWAGKDQSRREGIEEGRLEGIEEGRLEGIEEGRKEAINQTALSMLNDNIDVKIISKYTGLTEEEILKLKK